MNVNGRAANDNGRKIMSGREPANDNSGSGYQVEEHDTGWQVTHVEVNDNSRSETPVAGTGLSPTEETTTPTNDN